MAEAPLHGDAVFGGMAVADELDAWMSFSAEELDFADASVALADGARGSLGGPCAPDEADELGCEDLDGFLLNDLDFEHIGSQAPHGLLTENLPAKLPALNPSPQSNPCPEGSSIPQVATACGQTGFSIPQSGPQSDFSSPQAGVQSDSSTPQVGSQSDFSTPQAGAQSDSSTPQVGSQSDFSNPQAGAQAGLSIHQAQCPVAGPDRSASSSVSEEPGESMGSTVKTPERKLTNNEDSMRGPLEPSSSSDGDQVNGGSTRSTEAHRQQVKVEQGQVDSCHASPQLTPLSSQATNPLPGMLPCPPMAGVPGYPYGVPPVPVMFHRMVPLTRVPPRRTRKASGAKKAQGQTAGAAEGQGGGGAADAASGESMPEARPAGGSPDAGADDSSEDGAGTKGEDWEKRQARLLRNRESAQLSRQRKKCYMEELELQLRTMSATVAELQNTIAHLTAENVGLRRQLAVYCPTPGGAAPGQPGAPSGAAPTAGSLGVMGPHPAMVGAFRGLYPMTPVVPIPRLKSNGSSQRGPKGAQNQDEKKRKAQAAKPVEVKEEAVSSDSNSPNPSKKVKATGPAPPRMSTAVLALFGILMVFSPFLSQLAGVSTGTADISTGQLQMQSTASWSQFGRSAFQAASWHHSLAKYWGKKVSAWDGSSGRVLMDVSNGVVALANQSTSAPTVGPTDHPTETLGSRLGQLGSSSAIPLPPREGWPAGGRSGPRASGPHVAKNRADCVEAKPERIQLGMNGTSCEGRTVFPATLVLPGDSGAQVKIDGDLVINAVMAGNHAAAVAAAAAAAATSGSASASPLAEQSRASSSTSMEERKKEKARIALTPEGKAVPLAGELSSGVPADHRALASLEPHQLRQLVMGVAAQNPQVPHAGPRMWALPGKASSGEGAEESAGPHAGSHEKIFSAGWKGSFIGSEMCSEIFQFEVSQLSQDGPHPGNTTGQGASQKPHSSASSRSNESDANKPVLSSRRMGIRQSQPQQRGGGGSGVGEGGTSKGLVAAREFVSAEEASRKPGEISHAPNDSMVVSIFADVEPEVPSGPSGAPDGPKGLSKIFVVVLVNGVKYITYACLMPSFSMKSSASLVPLVT